MRRTIDTLTILKLTGLVAALVIALALALGTLLPETFSRAQASTVSGVNAADVSQVYYGRKKKKKKRKRKRRGFFDSDYGGGAGAGGGGGSYHTNPDPDPEDLARP